MGAHGSEDVRNSMRHGLRLTWSGLDTRSNCKVEKGMEMFEKIDEKKIKKMISLIVKGKVGEVLESANAGNIDDLVVIGILLLENRIYDMAEKIFSRVVQVAPDNVLAWYNKGVALGNLGKYEEEITCYDEALRIDPQYAKAWSNKGVALDNLGKYEEEITCYDEALRIDPQDADAWSNKGVALGNLGKYEEEITCYDEALRIDPQDAKAWSNKGVALGNLGKYEEEITCYDEALRIDPQYAKAWYNKGVALDNLGKYEEEITCYDEALRIDPQSAEAWYNKGVALGNLGKHEEAITCYDEALRIDPQSAEAYGNLGIAFLDSYQYKNAIDNLQKARDLLLERKSKNDADRVTACQLWAEALENWSREEYEKALSCFNKAIIIFRNLQFTSAADSLELISKIIPLDQQFMNALHAESLVELREKISEVCTGTEELLDNIEEKNISVDAEEIFSAKSTCFIALYTALLFEEPDFERLNTARATFEKLRFDTSVVAVNSLENFIRVLNRYEKLEGIPQNDQDFLLHSLKTLYVLDGLLTGKIPVEREYFTSTTGREESEIVYHDIENTEKEWVRVCLVQLDFSLEPLRPPDDFGYVLKEKEQIKKKVFEALKIASTHTVDIICFPELSTTEEWIEEAKEYKNITIIFGTYYKNGFNTCPIIVKGHDYYIQKINPSPQFETEVIYGRKMKKGKKIFVFQTKCGVFTILICMDYLREAHRILSSSDEKIKNVDLIIVPEYNKDTRRFQKQGDMHCLSEESYPYVVQVNSLTVSQKKVGGTCVIGAEHRDALQRYTMDRLKPEDTIEYKLVETQEESMIIVDLDIKRKGIPVPASGLKMKVLQRYTFESDGWNAIGF